MKQTATDYFYDRVLKLFMQYHEEDVPTIDFSQVITEAYERAKAIEQMQIIKAHFDAQPFNATMLHNAEQYYKDTYNQ